MTYTYWAAALMADGSEELLDLEAPGYRERLARAVRVSLIPKDPRSPLQPVVVNIPIGAQPIFLARTKGKLAMSGTGETRIRIYGVGYSLAGHDFIVWALPTGAVEIGEDSPMADLLLERAYAAIT